MTIEFINDKHELLPQVKMLGRKFAATLGFMPEGGFDDYARAKCIITASEGNELMGYLMFRQTSRYSRIAIVHLVVDKQYRGKGVSTALLEALRDRFHDSGATGIVLNCRRDYEKPSQMWERFGFIASGNHRSRSYDEHYLTTWWYDFHARDLFTDVYNESNKVKAMMDMNVILKLRDAAEDGVKFAPKEDPRCLLQDWLVEETELCYAPEVFNEINRDKNLRRAEKTQQYIKSAFTEVEVDAEAVKEICKVLNTLLPGKTVNSVSDRKQVASCIAAGLSYFLTFDEPLLKRKEEIEARYDVQIYTPQEFLLKIDQLLHREEYAPAMLSGVTMHTLKRQDAEGLKANKKRFLCTGVKERKKSFENEVDGCVNNGGEIYTVRYLGEDIAFYGVTDDGETKIINFLRIQEGPLKGSLFCQIVTDRLKECVAGKWKRLEIAERFLTPDERSTLQRLGFIPTMEARMVKEIRDEIVERSKFGALSDDELIQLEIRYYPMKILDLDIPVYIIPIKALWAGHLFDNVISSENLFGADPSKLWNFENVYYRSRRPLTEVAPARILWYVCQRKDSDTHSKAIVGSSYLTEVYTGSGRELFRMLKHYGIYEWTDIKNTLCKEDDNRIIRALKFSHTELFVKVVGYDQVQDILMRNGYGKNTFNSPVKVDGRVFFEIYRMGKGMYIK